MEDFTMNIVIPAVHAEEFISLMCYAGHYKEYVDDSGNPGEMMLNPVSKETFAQNETFSVLKQYARGKKHRRDEEVLRQAQLDSADNTALDSFLCK